ncbi:hypothetical protein [Corynebacterium renale]|nr:hypothetical protein [Corynebacterium renale]
MRRVEKAILAMWPQTMVPAYIWFNTYADVYTDLVEEAQAELVDIAAETVDIQLAEQGYTGPTGLTANPEAFIGATGTGQAVMGLAYAQALRVTHAQDNPETTYYQKHQIWNYAGAMLFQATQTALADTSRTAKMVQATARPGTAMIRVVRPPCCARCAILAGKVGINVGFDRHPNCDCDAVPFADYNNRHTDPELKNYMFDTGEYFASLTEQQQNKIFTRAGAQAIRDGADPAQVVNARRGMRKASDKFGSRPVFTDEGTTVRGWASRYLRQSYNQKMVKRGGRYMQTQRPRLMPEEIYRITGGDPDWSLSMLHANGYLLDASPQLDGKRSWFPRDEQVAAARDRTTAKMIARYEKKMGAERDRRDLSADSRQHPSYSELVVTTEKQFKNRKRRALNAARMVHGKQVPVPDIKISLMDPRNFTAAENRNLRGRSRVDQGWIVINGAKQGQELTILHEVGHHIERFVLPDSKSLERFARVASGTVTVRELRKCKERALSAKELGHYDYLLGNREIFARAYAQWVTIESGNRRLGILLNRHRRSEYSDSLEQWPDDDFTVLHEALNQLFKGSR